jgi:hypothetical protein
LKARTTLALHAFLAAMALAACDRPHSEEAVRAEKKSDPPSVTQTVELTAAEGSTALTGVATVLSPETLSQIDADLRAATIATGFSSGTAERYKSAKSLSRQSVETAERAAGTDATQLKLLEARLKHTWGDGAPFLDADDREKLLSDLNAGTQALVRLDFPNVSKDKPRKVRVAPLSGGDGTEVKSIWIAPSGNLSMPGVSYFGLIDSGPGLRPGDRARLMAEGVETHSGVIIPNSAIVIFAGQSWCFVETAHEKFERRAVSLDLPLDDGYLVKAGFAPGARVVVRGASLLLSREAGPGEDDNEENDKKSSAPDDTKSAPVKPEPVMPGQGGQAAQSLTQPAAKATSSNDKDPD